jgi:hypothetical protein
MTSYLKIAIVQEKAMCILRVFEIRSVIEMQLRYRNQYGKDPPSDNAVRRVLKQFQETGSVLYRRVEGRPRTSQMLIESRKRFLEAQKNQVDELLCS